MVSKWWTGSACLNPGRKRHQSKIYAESNQSDFWKTFGDLTSMQTLALYPRLLIQETDVAKSSHGLRNGTTKDDRDREMFFLLRMAFWLGLVLVLLPREKTPESDKLPQIGATEAVTAATAAVSDMSQFCKRQPAACEVGGQAATILGQRAQEGANKIYHIITDKTDKKPPNITDKKAPDHTGSIGEPEAAPTDAVKDTLTPDDLMAEWHVAPAP
jgi:hypothetical protein